MKAKASLTNLLIILAGASAVFGQPQPAQLEITVRDQVWYFDGGDVNRYSTSQDMVMVPKFPPFQPCVGIADVISVNGRPVKGALLMHGSQLLPSPNATPGRSISDIQRAALWSVYLEILETDGRQIGTLMASGMHGGAADTLPGGPKASAAAGNWAITGGTGAFLGVSGQIVVSGNVANQTVRFVSMETDPLIRRASGMGPVKYVVQLTRATEPEVARIPTGPAVFHSDFSPVTATSPAAPGEALIVRATGLGPVRGSLESGQPFPADPLAIVNSPVEVHVAGVSAEVDQPSRLEFTNRTE